MIALLLASAALADPPALPAQGPPAWTEARGALEDADWEGALRAAQDTLRADGGHAGAKFVEGYALHRMRRWEASLRAIEQVVDDPQVGELARRHVALYDHRWRRDQPALSLGLSMNDDRGLHPRALRPSLTAQLEVPVVWRFNLRADLATAWATEGPLALQGPLVGLLPVYQHPVSIYAFDLAAGPTLWTGPSVFWEGAAGGPAPGARVAVGASARPLKNLGVRLEGGWGANRGTQEMLDGWSRGFDLRLLVTGYAW